MVYRRRPVYPTATRRARKPHFIQEKRVNSSETPLRRRSTAVRTPCGILRKRNPDLTSGNHALIVLLDEIMPTKKERTMNTTILAVTLVLLIANVAVAQDKNFPQAKVSFEDFKSLVAEVESHRAERLIDLDTFLKMSKQPGAIILDTRSTFRYERIHVKGALHLSFTDFTQDNLEKVIPAFETTILIYCNNNFEGNQTDFASKIAMPVSQREDALSEQFKAQSKPLMMALNIPTYINLYGYGYRNVYELNELVQVNDPRITFEGSVVEQTPTVPPRLLDSK